MKRQKTRFNDAVRNRKAQRSHFFGNILVVSEKGLLRSNKFTYSKIVMHS